MKITLIGHYPPPYGGVGSLLKQMEAALSLRGMRPSIFNLGPGRPTGSNVVNFDTRNRVREFFQLARAFAFSESDVFHYVSASHRSFWLGVVCIILARLTGRRIVVSLVGGSFRDFICSLGARKRRLAALSLRLSQAVVACNVEIEKVLRELVPGKPVHRMSNCFPVSADEKSELPNRLGEFIRAHSPLVSLTGAASPEYGLLHAVNALHLLRMRFPKIGFVLALTRYGDSSHEQELLGSIESLGLGEHILIERDLPDFISLLRSSDVMLRSTVVDGDSISVREALFLGLPVVASDTPFRPEGVIIFRKGDALDMTEKLTQALTSKTVVPAADARKESEDNLARLLDIYAAASGVGHADRSEGRVRPQPPRPGYEA